MLNVPTLVHKLLLWLIRPQQIVQLLIVSIGMQTANSAGLSDQGSTSYSFLAGGGTLSSIVIPANVPNGNYNGTLTFTNLTTGCSNSVGINLTIGVAITVQPISPASTCVGSGSQMLSVTAIRIRNINLPMVQGNGRQWYSCG